jgi:hypothetical protein
MSAVQQTESRTSNGGSVPATDEKRPEVRPDDHPVFKKDSIREQEEHWTSQMLKTLGLGGVFALSQLGVVVAVGYIACQVLKADGLDGNQKIIGVAFMGLVLVILGLAALVTGANTHAKATKDNADQSADA